MKRTGATLLLFVLAAAALPLAAHDNREVERRAVSLDRAQTLFVLHCGGCHGTLGNSPPASVPVLRGRAGYFLCTRKGREYLARLPNIAFSPLGDEELAQVLNFVAFRLGDTEPAKPARPFDASEVAQLRRQPLNRDGLVAYRREVVGGLVRECGATRRLYDYKGHG